MFEAKPKWTAYWPGYLIMTAVIATLVAVIMLSPQQIPIIIYKVHLVCLGVLIGYIANEMFLNVKNEIAQAILIIAAIHGLTGGL